MRLVTPDPRPAPGPNFRCGPCAPVDNSPPLGLKILFALIPIPGLDEAAATDALESIATEFGEGPAGAAIQTFKHGGVEALDRGIKSYQKLIAAHEQKIVNAEQLGGFVSSMQREVRAFEANLGALESVRNLVQRP